MGSRRIAALPDHLLERGRSWFTTEEAAIWAGRSRKCIRPALQRLTLAKQVFSPARELYVVVPPEHRAWGVTPASWFIDPMMEHLGRAYYVALLSAAEMLGAAHHAPQVFQVFVDRTLRSRALGRVRIQFLTSSDLGDRPAERRNVPTGTVRISTPEVTALDLTDRPGEAGGMSNVTTLMIELVRERGLDDGLIADLSGGYAHATGQRLGYVLEAHAGKSMNHLHRVLAARGTGPAPLQPGGPRRGPVDPRWRVRLNTVLEPDA